ncbi:hypothetical protein Tco_1218784 [Tanacetum coccineum]
MDSPIMPENPYALQNGYLLGPTIPDYIPGPEVPPSPDYIPGPEGPPLPDYMPGPEEPEQAPPLPVYLPYVPEPVYPEYIPPVGMMRFSSLRNTMPCCYLTYASHQDTFPESESKGGSHEECPLTTL